MLNPLLVGPLRRLCPGAVSATEKGLYVSSRPEVAGHDRPLPGNAISILANLLVYPVGDTLTQCDPFGIPSTSHWTDAAIIVQCSRTKNYIVTRPRTSPQADALLFGRVTYEMMEAAFRPPARTGARPDWMEPFARTIDAAKKYVVSGTMDRVDWNAELVRGDLGKAVQQLKRESGKGLLMGGVKLPLALAELGLIDEYEFLVQPRLAGHGPTLFAGLSKRVDLKLVSRLEFGSGVVAMRYEPRR
jgi:dihydrofolate reductase